VKIIKNNKEHKGKGLVKNNNKKKNLHHLKKYKIMKMIY
jgi:hypothetical protein